VGRVVSAAPANLRRRMSERRREKLRALSALIACGLNLSWAALGIGVHPSTASRWRKREANGESLARRRGPRVQPLSAAVSRQAVHLVEEMHGLIGAEALRHSVAGLTRRAAAEIKTDTCRLMERDRRQGSARVTIASPGVLRGFDVMELGRREEHRHALIAADGCVPYRTSWIVASRYDGATVAEMLRRDFDTCGPPLVLRLDRATSHDVPEVRDLLETHDVLALHGPAYYAPYYGQLERQNREHREWLATSPGALDLDAMMAALNRLWRRSTLGWRTAEELWQRRPMINVDRAALAADVNERARRLRRRLNATTKTQDLAWRLAVKRELINRGLLRIEKGGWC
jgi:hypothetical protein